MNKSMNKRINDEYGVISEMRLLEKVTLFGLCLFFFFTVIYLFHFLGGSASKESVCIGSTQAQLWIGR